VTLGKGVETRWRSLAHLAPSRSAIERQLGTLNRLESIRKAAEIIAPVVAGLVLGAIVLFARELPSEWAGLVILATISPTVVLLVNDVRKLLLITLVVDIPLGLDIMLGDQPGHVGGSTGFSVSLMTMALVVGYAIWLAERPASSQSKIRTHKDITVPALVYLFFLLVSAFQAVDVWFSIVQLFLEIQFLLMYFYVINHVKTRAAVRLIFTILVLCLFFESVVMLLQYFVGFELTALGIGTQTTGSSIASATKRVGGTIGSPNGAATYLATSLAITFAAYLTGNRLINKKLTLIALLVGCAALVTTQSRSGWIACTVAMLILVTQALRKQVGVRAVLLLLVVAVIIGAVFSTQIIDRLTTDDQGSAESRTWYNELAFNIINAHMFTGIGLNNLWLVMRDYLPLELLGSKHSQYLYIVHNKYLLVWAETGLFGFLAFLWLLLAACRRALQALIQTKDVYTSIVITGLLSALVVYLLHMSSDPFASRVRMQPVWLIMALIAATSQLAGETEQQSVTIKGTPKSQITVSPGT